VEVGRGLRAVLERAQARRYLGPAHIDAQVTHAAGFAAAAALDREPELVVDLGTGGGLPGLVVALYWPTARVVLVEASAGRSAFLQGAVQELDLGSRVSVRHERAELSGRDPALRSGADVVVSRAFGGPAVAAECAAPLLCVGGVAVVSEPPEERSRWSSRGLAELALEDEGTVLAGARFRRLRAVALCPDRFPRRPGVPSKRPLF
jgi:16S rRNA (guanine527-N7)-methyltransferase